MADIQTNMIIVWAGTNAAIPGGFTRETTLDAKYVKGSAADTDPNTTGGSANHSHSATANHSHTMAAHTHTVTMNYSAAHSSNSSDSSGSEGPPGTHFHSAAIGGVSGGGLSSVAATYASLSNDPPYHEVIFIKASSRKKVPDDGILFTTATSAPTGFTECDGSGTTPDLQDKYLKGAATDGDAGGTGGSTTNVHDLTHTHSESSHTHSGNIGNAQHPSGFNRGGGGSNRLGGHSHTVSLNSSTAGSISSESLTTAETVEPAYHKLFSLQNTSGGDKEVEKNMIVMWLGTLATIPAGWFLCDGNNNTPDLREKFLKVANGGGEVGDTGGSATHTHASQGHTHTGGSHTHSGNSGGSSHTNSIGSVGGSRDLQDGGSAHTFSSVSSNAASWASANTAADSQNNEPEYRTVAYIQYQFDVGAGVLAGLM